MRHFLQKPEYRLLQALIFWIFSFRSLYCESWLLVSSYLVYAEEEIMTENSVQNYYTDFSMVITHEQIGIPPKDSQILGLLAVVRARDSKC